MSTLYRKRRWNLFYKYLTAVMGVFCLMFIQETASAGDSPSPKPRRYDVVFPAKLFCSQKYPVVVPFKGRIENVYVTVGRKVKRDDVLVSYALSLEAVMGLRKKLGNPRIRELEMDLAQVAGDLVDLGSVRDRLLATGADPFGPDVKVIQKRMEAREILKKTVLSRLDLERALALDERKLLGRELGRSLNPNQVPEKAVLNAPMDGYIIWINPGLKKGAEISRGTAAFQVGVMNPLTARAEVFENEALKIAPGDRGKMVIESMRERDFDVEISYVSWVPRSSGILNPSYYAVEMTVPNADLLLREGLMGSVRFTGSR